MELWDYLCINGNPCHHPADYILHNVAAYKVSDCGYVYFSWFNDNDLSFHTALHKPVARGRWLDFMRIAYYLGADRLLVTGEIPLASRRIAKHFGFEKKGNMLYIELPYTEKE